MDGRVEVGTGNPQGRVLQRDHRGHGRHGALPIPHEATARTSEVVSLRRSDRNRKVCLHHREDTSSCWTSFENLLEVCVSVAGVSFESNGQGGVQTKHHQLFGADERQPDPKHHHVQARQTPKGRLWSAIRQKGCKSSLQKAFITMFLHQW